MANSTETDISMNPHIKVQKAKFKPCFKHAVEIIAESPSIEKTNKQFCENCSQSMLSYIFLIQDALDNLAIKIYGGENKNCCLQCLRQELQTKINTIENSEPTASINELQKGLKNELLLQSITDDVTILQKDIPINENSAPKPVRKSSIRRNSRRLSREQKEYENLNSRTSLSIENNVDKQGWKIPFLYDLTPKYNEDYQTTRYEGNDFTNNVVVKVNKEQCANELVVVHHSQENNKSEDQVLPNDNSKENILRSSGDKNRLSHDQIKSQNIPETFLEDSHQIALDNSPLNLNSHNDKVVSDSAKNNYVQDETPFLIKFTESCTENKVESLENSLITNGDELVRDCGQLLTKKQNTSEAFVTICRNNSEVLGCLVLGCSLQLCRSSKTLCVLVLDEVDTNLRDALSSVFNVVETVTSLDSANSTTSTEMRNFLSKLNIWRLLNFSKCVFLNPDTLVIRNCDELFEWDELSAVPDTGWPDCFNTGVFVFVPSTEKFLELVELTKKQGHENDGEEMVLNSFFDSWARDISKKLSFIYNLVDNASYTYASAFHRFGHNVKIVQFTGSPKPWQVKFCSHTNQIQEVTGVHPNFIRFFHEWISIFRVAVLRLLSQDINSKVLSQNIIAAEDILQFIEPSVRHEIPDYISDSNNEYFSIMDSQTDFSEKNKKGTFTVCSKLQTDMKEVEQEFCNKLFSIANSTPFLIPSIGMAHSEQNDEFNLDGTEISAISNDISEVNVRYGTKNLPGSVMGDYQGMRVWEQGQMDYAGCDNSENIIKRLQFLMDQPKYMVSLI